MIVFIASTLILAPEPLENPTLFHRLAQKGMHLTFRPAHKNSKPKGGILLISDFQQKAPIFLTWLPMAKFRPPYKVTVQKAL